MKEVKKKTWQLKTLICFLKGMLVICLFMIPTRFAVDFLPQNTDSSIKNILDTIFFIELISLFALLIGTFIVILFPKKEK